MANFTVYPGRLVSFTDLEGVHWSTADKNTSFHKAQLSSKPPESAISKGVYDMRLQRSWKFPRLKS